MNNSIKCYFCSDAFVFHSKIAEGKYIGMCRPKVECEEYRCQKCDCRFWYQTTKLIGYLFIVDFNSDIFQVGWLEENNQTSIRKNYETLISFPYQAPLTPHNFSTKINTILTFL